MPHDPKKFDAAFAEGLVNENSYLRTENLALKSGYEVTLKGFSDLQANYLKITDENASLTRRVLELETLAAQAGDLKCQQCGFRGSMTDETCSKCGHVLWHTLLRHRIDQLEDENRRLRKR